MKERINARLGRYIKERNTVLRMIDNSVSLMLSDDSEITNVRIQSINNWASDLTELTAKIKELTILLNND